jgi:hypothetical protein
MASAIERKLLAPSRQPYCTHCIYKNHFNNMDCHAFLPMGASTLRRLAHPYGCLGFFLVCPYCTHCTYRTYFNNMDCLLCTDAI